MVFLEWNWYEHDGRFYHSICGITDLYVTSNRNDLYIIFNRGNGVYSIHDIPAQKIREVFCVI